MAVSSAAVSVSVSVGELSSLVARQYARALSSSTLVFYPSSTVRTLVALDVRWQLRVVPSLLAKSRAQPHPASASAPAPAPAPADVFAPPYNADLLVGTLPSHAVLLNKFCVVPEHFLLVTQQFESQDRPPAPDTIALAYSIIKHARTDTLAFYNCGKDSGASQPHRHVQFIPLDADGIPVEKMLDRIEKDGREMEHVHALPVPWQHFTVLLNGSEDEAYLAHRFTVLLDCMFRARMVANNPVGAGGGPPSFNILISRRAMHLIPRSKENYTLNLAGGGETEISVNSLGYAGFLLAKSEEEENALANLDGGVLAVLAATGVPPLEDASVAHGLPTSN